MSRRRKRDEGDSTGGLIPYKNGAALAAYYCAIFSLIPCIGIPLGAIAVVLGFLGLNKHKQNPRVSGLAHAWIGIILGGLTLLANVGVIAVMVIGAIASSQR